MIPDLFTSIRTHDQIVAEANRQADERFAEIQLTPDYRRTTEAAFRAFARSVYGDKPRIWQVENRTTGEVDLLVGPCSIDGLIETLRVIEGPLGF